MSRKTDAVVARTVGIDTGKNTLHLIGLDDSCVADAAACGRACRRGFARRATPPPFGSRGAVRPARAGSTCAPPHAMPATRATSRSTWPFAQSFPRRTIGTERMPSIASSAKASLSSSTLTETKGTPCLVKNSFILRQLVQPGCQYALMTEASGDDCAMGMLLKRRRERRFSDRGAWDPGHRGARRRTG
jgi:hypothetical protein